MPEWLKQAKTEPLFADLLWSRPENKQAAGKLLIVGGNLHSFAAVNKCYAASLKAGIGTARVVLPDSLAKSLGKVFPEAEFAPSNLSGSFGQDALATVLDAASWADGILLAGDFGKNSETAILLEKFIQKFSGPLALSGDSLGYFLNDSQKLIERPVTVIAARLDQLQKLFAKQILIKHSMGLHQLIDALAGLSAKAVVVTSAARHVLVAQSDRASSTAAPSMDLENVAAYAAVWLAQQPNQPFEAVTTATFCANQL